MLVYQMDQSCEILILGAGWSSTFLIPLLEKKGIRYAATTTTGRDGTIPFKFDPESEDETPFRLLPTAATILITFPLKGAGLATKLTSFYRDTRPQPAGLEPHYILFGATSIWITPGWQDENSPYHKTNARAIAEDELMSVANGCSLNLAGLYGGSRMPRNWVDRVIKTKADLSAKGALHLIHGVDVARAVIALHQNFTPAKRWLLCDMHVYDWWDLIQDWATQAVTEATILSHSESGSKSDASAIQAQAQQIALDRQKELQAWVGELMVEKDVQALPRDSERLGRRLDGRAFWREMGLWPSQGRAR